MKMVKMNFILWNTPSNIILIENTKFCVVVGCVCVYIYIDITYEIKNVCVYIIKKHICIYMCVQSYLDKYISAATWFPKQKFPAPPLYIYI